MNKSIPQHLRALCLFLILCPFCLQGAGQVQPTDNGVQITTGPGQLKIEFVSPDVARIRFTRGDTWSGNHTSVCLPHPEKSGVAFRLKQQGQQLTLSTDSLILRVALPSGAITYSDAATGRLLLSENPATPHSGARTYIEKVTYDESTRRKIQTANGERWIADVARRDTLGRAWKYQVRYRFAPGEALYGLGSHMEDYLNLRGKKLYLIQHNLKAVVPVLTSTAGYGLLFDAGCSMRFDDEGGQGLLELEAAQELDYYFMKGSRPDQVVAQYRRLTGQSPMLPRYIFGYIQSKERYRSSEELINVVKEYRKRQIPLDVIVQDWSYWPQGSWGYIKMDPQFYPDPQQLADSIHALNAKLMVSIWPNPSNCPQADDFRQRGYMLPSGVAYDAFSADARRYYWKYANDEFFSRGFDAWWCDCTEPIDGDWSVMPQGYDWNSHEERWERNTQCLNDALGAERANLYSLFHSQGIYENQRSTSLEKRVVNLTRSAYAGQQRYATITWSGDTSASWEAFARQIPAGLNFMATGCPYWTVDIGAFFTVTSETWFRCGDFPQGVSDSGYRELYTRMLQYATFMPLMRSHGTDTPREIWRFGQPGQPFYDVIARYIRLRYQLLPYTYSLAGRVTQADYTPVRLLAFDFAQDSAVLDLKDEYMYGPSLLVCPVTKPMYYGPSSQPLQQTQKTRSVYLPRGRQWTDFWTEKHYEGGQTIKADAPLEKIPLYVPDGSILPLGPVVQYSAEQSGKMLTLHIYPGRDADFTLYEDEGDSYRYEQGAFSTIPLHWDEAAQTLTIGRRKGSYEGMPAERDFRIVVHHEGQPATKDVHYTGAEISKQF
ncbi:MAG: TIM-barrel domain-containing protein [Bacteroidaceae bacterium]|jgi:alpha-D-xyloside xylohydrolase